MINEKVKSLVDKLKNSESIKKILSNVSWILFERILKVIVNLLVGAWTARFLKPDGFGDLNTAISLTVITFSITSFGFEGTLSQKLILFPEKKNIFIFSAFLIKLFSSFIAIILTILYAFIFYEPSSMLFQVIVIVSLAVLFQAFDVIDVWYQSQVKSKITVIVRSIAFLIVNFLKIIFILLEYDIRYFALTFTLEFLIAAIGFIYVYIKKEKSLDLKFDKESFYILLSEGWPLCLSAIFGAIYMRIDQLMLSKMVSNQEVGHYSAAVKICEIFYIIPMAIFTSLFPNIVKTKEKDENVYMFKLQKLFNLMSFLGYLLAIPITIFANQIINILYGTHYQKAVPMLIILIWSNLFVNLGIARNAFLMPYKLYKIHTLTVILGCISNILANIILIPLYGGIGAAIASFIAYSVAAYFSCIFIKRLHHVFIMMTKSIFLPNISWKF